MFPKVNTLTTVGELLAFTESLYDFYKSEQRNLYGIAHSNSCDQGALLEQQRLTDHIYTYLMQAKGIAHLAGADFLIELRVWESNTPFKP